MQALAEGGTDRLLRRMQFYLAQLIEQRCPAWARQYPDRPRLLGRTDDSGEVKTREQGDAYKILLTADFEVHTPEWGWLNEWRWNRWVKRQLDDAVALAIEDIAADTFTTATDCSDPEICVD